MPPLTIPVNIQYCGVSLRFSCLQFFAETLERGIREDERAQWTRARAYYEDALARVGSMDAAFGPVAARVVRLDTLYKDLGLGALSSVRASAVTAYALGRACAGAGDADDAARAFDRAVAADADFAEARIALERFRTSERKPA